MASDYSFVMMFVASHLNTNFSLKPFQNQFENPLQNLFLIPCGERESRGHRELVSVVFPLLVIVAKRGSVSRVAAF